MSTEPLAVIETTATPDTMLDQQIKAATIDYNERFVADDHEPLSVYCKDSNGRLIGGLTAKTYWHYLDIAYLWVDETQRLQGLANRIMDQAEDIARQRGCQYAMLDTYEFQALGFYRQRGYQQFGCLQGYCGKYQRYFLSKNL